MASDEKDRILAKIGQLLAEDTKYPLDGTLLHAEVDWNCVAPAIFKNRGNSIVFRWADLDRLGGALMDLWDAEEPQNRWAEVEYLIQGDSFEVAYNYKDDIDPEERPLARRDRIVKRYFGDKPIIYPPWPEEDDNPSYEL